MDWKGGDDRFGDIRSRELCERLIDNPARPAVIGTVRGEGYLVAAPVNPKGDEG